MYKLTSENYVIKGDLRFSIADSPEYPNTNPEYLAYREWLDAGGLPEPADISAEQWRSRIAERRWSAEVAGVTVSVMRVETDDRAKLLINGAAVEAMIDPEYVMSWKTDDGFVELTGAQVIGIARAVRSHVQACFDREAELIALVESGKMTDQALDEGWPS